MNDATIVLGGHPVYLLASLAWTQSYEEIGGFSMRRMLNGTAARQQHWSKLRTQITALGWIPPGLAALDYSQSMTLACAAPRAVSAPSNVITLPAARRSDTGYAPIGYALLNGQRRQTPLVMAGNVATLTPVTGATQYVALYVPSITVFASPPRDDFDAARGEWAWQLDAEEV